jgi:serine/threonine-protein kinase HipA
VADELAVWLYGSHVATIERERWRPRLTYTAEALRRYSPGTPLLSLSLPVRPERHTQGVVRPFLDGLLPEGESRLAVARNFNLRASDTYGLIRAIGRDCAGAVVIQPAQEPPPRPASTLTAEPLTERDISELIANLRTAPLGVDERVRLSLGGVQEKLLLTRMPDGRWGRPVDGTPTTHIIKPQIERFPATVENEAFCMRVAKSLGLSVAPVETTMIGGRNLLVIGRFDRVVDETGAVVRIHQEDFCQATGVLPDNKYEEDGGPSLKKIADVLQAAAAPDSLDALLRAVTVNVLVTNGDAHGKNFSLLHHESGALTLSPLYDVLGTLHYGVDRLAMHIDNVRRIDKVTVGRIVNEAERWGMSRNRAAEVVNDLLARASEAIDAARQETDGLPDDLFATVTGQLTQMKSES